MGKSLPFVVLAACALAACSDSPEPPATAADTGSDTVEADTQSDADAGRFDVPDEPDAVGDTVDVEDDVDVENDAVEDTTEDEDIWVGPVCGNGIIELGEVCDDNNNFSGDGCSLDCLSTEECGNAIVDLDEQCDDGNFNPGDGCDAECKNEEGCGNGVIGVGEQCDDGNLVNGDGCSDDCVRELFSVLDSDEDGISDFDEGSGLVDTDEDGDPDSADLDSDDDGILDAVEAGDTDLATPPFDSDDDETPDFRDLDSDADLISDEVEGDIDTDGDGIGNFADSDSDGDYVPDIVEGVVDSDEDGERDYLDTDSDDDTILDLHELLADSDEDGIPNRIDDDSDGDGLLDSDEAGDDDPETYPFDLDADGQPNYIDVDSDGDGLPDAAEPGCSAGGPNGNDPDSDDDGYSDLAEWLVGADTCAFTTAEAFAEFTDFFFVLPGDGTASEAPLEFSSDLIKADIAINMDTTATMGGEIGELRTTFSSQVFPRTAELIADPAFAVSTFDDFLCDEHGQGSDLPFRLLQRMTTSVTTAQGVMNAIPLHSGSDIEESGYEALYQVATGAGVTGCDTVVPPFDPARFEIEGVADGDIGGVGFRDDSFPVVVHITDAVARDGSEYGDFAATRDDAVDALNDIQARVVGVASGIEPVDQLQDIALSTGAVVRTCAWDGARPFGCGSTQCCTGIDGLGRNPVGGECPLVFQINDDGTGLGPTIVTAIGALGRGTNFDVTTVLRADEIELAATGLDTRCFIRSITPDSSETTGTCTTVPEFADINPIDGIDDSFRNVTVGTQLFFDVVAQNDGCIAETDLPQAFTAFIDVVGDGVTLLDTMRVTIIVPADSTNPASVP